VCAGARHVTLLDREPKALQCALLTAAASGLKTTVSADAFSASEQEAEELRSFTDRLQQCAPKHSSTVGGQSAVISASLFDWNNAVVNEPYDTVIACDVLYDSVAVEPLARLLPDMLAGPVQDGRRILLTDPQDRTPEHRKRFLDLLAQHDPSLVVDFVKTVEVDHSTASNAPVKVWFPYRSG
jgi:predicted nicotinamide N-methyase